MTATLDVLLETLDLLDGLTDALESLTVPPTRRGEAHQRTDVDVLSDVLRVVRLSGAVFFTADFSTPWAIESPMPDRLAAAVIPQAETVVLFHILVDGACEVVCPGHATTRMEAGDVVVFPRGDQHVMRSHPTASTTPLTSVFSPGKHDEPPQLSFGGGGQTSRFVC